MKKIINNSLYLIQTEKKSSPTLLLQKSLMSYETNKYQLVPLQKDKKCYFSKCLPLLLLIKCFPLLLLIKSCIKYYLSPISNVTAHSKLPSQNLKNISFIQLFFFILIYLFLLLFHQNVLRHLHKIVISEKVLILFRHSLINNGFSTIIVIFIVSLF